VPGRAAAYRGRVILCVNVTEDGRVGGGWGRAPRVAVAEVTGGAVVRWDEHDVGWDRLHDEGGEGAHHARIVRFVREHGAEVVVSGHMGPPMQHSMARLGVRVVLAGGDAREAAVAAAS